jgi:hypothetical protein
MYHYSEWSIGQTPSPQHMQPCLKHAHTHMQTCMHMLTNARTHAYKYMQAHTHTCKHMPERMHVNTHTHTQTGVWISFSRHSPNWRAVKDFHSLSQKTTGPIYRNCQWGEKFLARLANGFVFLLAKSEFYLHLASWRVFIRTPAHKYA